MKIRLFSLLAAAALMLGGTVSAVAQFGANSADIKVPFSFYVGNTLLQAGDYHINVDPASNRIIVNSGKAGEGAMAVAEYSWASPTGSLPHQQNNSDNKSVPTAEQEYFQHLPPMAQSSVIFDQSSGQHFLRVVSDSTGVNFLLPQPDREQSLTREHPDVQRVMVKASD